MRADKFLQQPSYRHLFPYGHEKISGVYLNRIDRAIEEAERVADRQRIIRLLKEKRDFIREITS